MKKCECGSSSFSLSIVCLSVSLPSFSLPLFLSFPISLFIPFSLFLFLSFYGLSLCFASVFLLHSLSCVTVFVFFLFFFSWSSDPDGSDDDIHKTILKNKKIKIKRWKLKNKFHIEWVCEWERRDRECVWEIETERKS